MFISDKDGPVTSTIRVDTGRDMLVAFVLIAVGFCLTLVSLRDPLHHWVQFLAGIVLMWPGFILARQTSRLMARAKRAYRNGIRP
jgi:uncharacterized membrane protein YjjB (DUF3815 family)